jgi:hypothetical protein
VLAIKWHKRIALCDPLPQQIAKKAASSATKALS